VTRWDVRRDGDDGDERKEKLPESAQQALEALQSLWSATGQAQDHLLELSGETHEGHPKGGHKHGGEGCATSIGFGGLEQMSEGEDSTYDREEAMTRMRTAWKTTLAREGKLTEGEE